MPLPINHKSNKLVPGPYHLFHWPFLWRWKILQWHNFLMVSILTLLNLSNYFDSIDKEREEFCWMARSSQEGCQESIWSSPEQIAFGGHRQNIAFDIVGCRQLLLVPLRSLSKVIMSILGPCRFPSWDPDLPVEFHQFDPSHDLKRHRHTDMCPQSKTINQGLDLDPGGYWWGSSTPSPH